MFTFGLRRAAGAALCLAGSGGAGRRGCRRAISLAASKACPECLLLLLGDGAE